MKGEPKFDIREWSQEYDKMSKGVTLTEDELWKLYLLLKDYFQAGGTTIEKDIDSDKSVEDYFFK